MARSAKVGDVIVNLKAKTEDFNLKLQKAAGFLRSVETPFSTIQSVAEKIHPALGKAVDRIGRVYAALDDLTGPTAALVQDQQRLAVATGATLDQLQRFDRAFATVGVTADKSHAAFAGFTDLLASARLGAEDAQARFKALGVDLEGLGEADAFQETLAHITEMKSLQEKQAALYGILGDKAGDYLQIVAQGGERFRDSLRDAGGLGETANKEFLSLGQAQARLWAAGERWGQAIATIVVPAFRQAVEVAASITGVMADAAEYVASWSSWATEIAGEYVPILKAQTSVAEQAERSATALQKQAEANLKVQAELRQGERSLLSFRNDYLAIQQEINVKHAEASKELRGQLVAQRVQAEQQKINGELLDTQIEIRSLVEYELGLRYRISKEMQLATKAQKDQAFFLQRQLDMTSKLEDMRQGGSVGGRDMLAQRQIDDMKKYTDANKAELDAMRAAADNALKQGLGDTLLPSDVRRERVASINADKYLSDDERKRAIGNANRQEVLDKRSFLEGLGRITPPLEKFSQSIEALKVELDKGRINKEEYDRLVSDTYKSQIGDQPKLAESFEAGTTQLYDRLSKFYSGMENRPLEKQIADNGRKAVAVLERIEKKTGAPMEPVQSIR